MNVELAKQKGLIIDNNKELYNRLENIYKAIFERYLNDNIDLKKYDEEILNSGYYFGVPNPTKDQLISGLGEYLGLKYIYLLNNFFIEKLEKEDIDILKACIEKNVIGIEAYEMVKKTYKEVIRNNYLKGKYERERYQVCYGYALPNNFAYNDDIVLKIYYSKNTKKLEDKEFIENLRNQKKILESIKERIIEEIKSKLNDTTTVIIEKIPN